MATNHGAMERFFEYHQASNGYTEGHFEKDPVEAIPGVEAAAGGDYFLLVPIDEPGQVHPEHLGQVSPFSTDTPKQYAAIGRPIIVDGELPDPSVEMEVAVDEEMAELYDLEAGDHLAMQGFGMDQLEQLFENIGTPVPTGEVFDFTVTGIVRSPQDVVPHQKVPDVVYMGSAEVLLGPAFDAAHRRVDVPSLGALFGDAGPAGPPASSCGSTSPRRRPMPSAPPSTRWIRRPSSTSAPVMRSGPPRRPAGRSGSRPRSSWPSVRWWRSVGSCSSPRRCAASSTPTARSSARSAPSAPPDRVPCGSPRQVRARGHGERRGGGARRDGGLPAHPVGHARRAEIDPGVDVEVIVLALGAMALVVLVVGFAVASAWRTTAAEQPAHRSRATTRGLSDRAAKAGMPPSVVAGVRAATLGAGGTTVLATVFVAALGIVGALGFAASEQTAGHRSRPLGLDVRCGGRGWQRRAALERAEEKLGGNPMIDAYAARMGVDAVTLSSGTGEFDAGASAIVDIEGTIEPSLLGATRPRRTTRWRLVAPRPTGSGWASAMRSRSMSATSPALHGDGDLGDAPWLRRGSHR